jgi:hypothetical protein
MTSGDYGLYLVIGIGFFWIAGVGCFIVDMVAKPKKNTIIKQTKKPSYPQSYDNKEEDSFVIIDDVSFPI